MGFSNASPSASALLADLRLALASEPAESAVSVELRTQSDTDEGCVKGGAEASFGRRVIDVPSGPAERAVSVGLRAPSDTEEGCVCGGAVVPVGRWVDFAPFGSGMALGGAAVVRVGAEGVLALASYSLRFMASF